MQVAPLLEVRNLTIDRGTYCAIEKVSFHLLPGTRTVIIGPNGAGKSTLIQAILGLIPYRSGSIHFEGSSHCDIGYIPQRFPFAQNFPLSVWEMVALGANGRVSSPKVRDALTQVGLEHKARTPIGVLSGGELKRALLAHCLVMPRKLLVMDEAMAGVDVAGEIAFAQLLNHLRQEHGWTILEVSHDLAMVEQHAEWVVCLNRSVCAQGVPQKVLTRDILTKLYGQPSAPYCHHHSYT